MKEVSIFVFSSLKSEIMALSELYSSHVLRVGVCNQVILESKESENTEHAQN